MKENKRKSRIWLIAALVFALGAIALGIWLYLHSSLGQPEPSQGEQTESMPVPALEPFESRTDIQDQAVTEPSPSTDEAEPPPEPYESPVDFASIWAVNEDVIAWLYIPGIEMSYPILMDPDDNTYYLTHDAEGNSSSAGALFIEDYNHPDFQDMCTVVYGHRMYDGDMFGVLQSSYSDEESLEKNQDIGVYLPDREIHYRVFAAVPYDDAHILYYNDFDDQLSYRKFINGIYAENGLNAVQVLSQKPVYGDRLLILSTCLWGDKNSRYLVLAKELSE